MYRVSVYNQQSAFLVRYLTCFFFLFIKSLREPSPLRRGEAHPTRAAAAGGSRLPRGRHTAGDGDGFGARLCPRRAVR